MKKLTLAALAATMVAGAALAHHDEDVFAKGDVVVSHAWTYENAETAHAMRVYLTIENTGTAPDRLTAASVTFADAVLLEGQAIGADGSLETRQFPAIAVAPGQVLTMQPGAVWIELQGVQRTFDAGDHFHMAVTFENAGSVEIDVEVEATGEHDHDHDHDHGEAGS